MRHASLLCAVLLASAAAPVGAYSTHPAVTLSREVRPAVPASGQPATVILRLRAGEVGAEPLRGVFLSEPLPVGLEPAAVAATIDGASAQLTPETSGQSDPGCITHRFVLEQPPDWPEDMALAAGTTLELRYELMIPDEQGAKLVFPGASWVGMLPVQGAAGDHFGFEDASWDPAVAAEPGPGTSGGPAGSAAPPEGADPAKGGAGPGGADAGAVLLGGCSLAVAEFGGPAVLVSWLALLILVARRRRPVAAALLSIALLAPRSVAAAVTISDATDEGIACFKVVTDSATYFFDKAGAGFTSILDKDGADWIGFRPEGTAGVPNGQSGWYRGIPNMGLNDFGHPGYTGATSTTADAKGTSLPKATIESTKGQWKVSWEFFPTHARMTIHSVGANYWLLYEGTPGGAVGNDDTVWRSDGQSSDLGTAWEGDVGNTSGVAPGMEWVYFADGTQDRSLVMIHDDDQITDRYYLMSPMTVFGFGRQAANIDRLLSATPATLTIALVETRALAEVKAQVTAILSGGTTPPPSLPALRDAVDQAIRDRRQGTAQEADVRDAIGAYRTP